MRPGRPDRGSVADVTPTVLYFLGLPIGRDMDGIARTDFFAAVVHGDAAGGVHSELRALNRAATSARDRGLGIGEGAAARLTLAQESHAVVRRHRGAVLARELPGP